LVFVGDMMQTEEDTSFYIRKNATTDYLIYTGTVGAARGF